MCYFYHHAVFLLGDKRKLNGNKKTDVTIKESGSWLLTICTVHVVMYTELALETDILEIKYYHS